MLVFRVHLFEVVAFENNDVRLPDEQRFQIKVKARRDSILPSLLFVMWVKPNGEFSLFLPNSSRGQ